MRPKYKRVAAFTCVLLVGLVAIVEVLRMQSIGRVGSLTEMEMSRITGGCSGDGTVCQNVVHPNCSTTCYLQGSEWWRNFGIPYAHCTGSPEGNCNDDQPQQACANAWKYTSVAKCNDNREGVLVGPTTYQPTCNLPG